MVALLPATSLMKISKRTELTELLFSLRLPLTQEQLVTLIARNSHITSNTFSNTNLPSLISHNFVTSLLDFPCLNWLL
jgi:hypothetical protein